jgi:hypothetical protein
MALPLSWWHRDHHPVLERLRVLSAFLHVTIVPIEDSVHLMRRDHLVTV